MKFLNVPHYSQLDNEFHPTGTCNLTKAAMCLAYHGIKPKQRVQLEDELYEYAKDNKLSRHVPEDIASIIKAHGCQKIGLRTTPRLKRSKSRSTMATLASCTECSPGRVTLLLPEGTISGG